MARKITAFGWNTRGPVGPSVKKVTYAVGPFRPKGDFARQHSGKVPIGNKPLAGTPGALWGKV